MVGLILVAVTCRGPHRACDVMAGLGLEAGVKRDPCYPCDAMAGLGLEVVGWMVLGRACGKHCRPYFGSWKAEGATPNLGYRGRPWLSSARGHAEPVISWATLVCKKVGGGGHADPVMAWMALICKWEGGGGSHRACDVMLGLGLEAGWRRGLHRACDFMAGIGLEAGGQWVLRLACGVMAGLILESEGGGARAEPVMSWPALVWKQVGGRGHGLSHLVLSPMAVILIRGYDGRRSKLLGSFILVGVTTEKDATCHPSRKVGTVRRDSWYSGVSHSDSEGGNMLLSYCRNLPAHRSPLLHHTLHTTWHCKHILTCSCQFADLHKTRSRKTDIPTSPVVSEWSDSVSLFVRCADYSGVPGIKNNHTSTLCACPRRLGLLWGWYGVANYSCDSIPQQYDPAHVPYTNIPLALRVRMIFQHDDTPPHFHCAEVQHLNVPFPERWVGQGGFHPWVPQLPDISPNVLHRGIDEGYCLPRGCKNTRMAIGSRPQLRPCSKCLPRQTASHTSAKHVPRVVQQSMSHFFSYSIKSFVVTLISHPTHPCTPLQQGDTTDCRPQPVPSTVSDSGSTVGHT
ncbi:hypothetical protein PR048_009112 [Dryococelus australis]|uniref:Uncharacterized protein n=1 Tax=Dryococelus australis TaxID=614101 RepID=A0ABQ9HZD5_9NEOP|nr:hypothetical protein PR048_009112 [Dryococelus australis]